MHVIYNYFKYEIPYLILFIPYFKIKLSKSSGHGQIFFKKVSARFRGIRYLDIKYEFAKTSIYIFIFL